MAALRSLADHPWVMEPEGTAARHWAMTLCRDAGFEPDVRFESTDLLLHLRLVEQRHAAAFLPALVWSGHVPEEPAEEWTTFAIDITDAHGDRFYREVTREEVEAASVRARAEAEAPIVILGPSSPAP